MPDDQPFVPTDHSQFRDVRMFDVPGYREWSEKYADRFPTAIANLDATGMWLSPEEAATRHPDSDFDTMLEDIIELISGEGKDEELADFYRIRDSSADT